MDCPQIPELDYTKFSLKFHSYATKNRFPLTGTIDITNRCNLRCVHCYIRDTSCGKELSYQEICYLLDQIADQGCLWLCITGGEPLVRPDFRDIYSYAKRKGFLINLFSNGTLLTPSLVDFLAEQPPFVLDITLYGMSAETYNKVTGVPEAFDRCIQGIEMAVERHIPIKLKTMVLTINRHEFQDMKQYAKRLGVSFRYDPLINARVDGSPEPKQYRLSPAEIVSLELADEEIASAMREEYDNLWGIGPRRDNLFVCGAGWKSFHITCDGKLNMCAILHVPDYDLRQGTFQEAFYEILPKIREQKRTRYSECQACPALNICGQCPAFSALEHGDMEMKTEFLCQTAKLRVAAFRKGGWEGDAVSK